MSTTSLYFCSFLWKTGSGMIGFFSKNSMRADAIVAFKYEVKKSLFVSYSPPGSTMFRNLQFFWPAMVHCSSLVVSPKNCLNTRSWKFMSRWKNLHLWTYICEPLVFNLCSKAKQHCKPEPVSWYLSMGSLGVGRSVLPHTDTRNACTHSGFLQVWKVWNYYWIFFWHSRPGIVIIYP